MPTLKQDTPQPPAEERDLTSAEIMGHLLNEDAPHAKYVTPALRKMLVAISDAHASELHQAQQAARLDELKAFQTDWYARPDGSLEEQPNASEDWLGWALYDRIAHLEAEQKEDSEQ